jgi:hypothetical protein
MGMAWSIHERGMRMCTKFWSESQKKSDDLEDIHIDGRIIFECALVAQNRKYWWALVNIVMKFWVP